MIRTPEKTTNNRIIAPYEKKQATNDLSFLCLFFNHLLHNGTLFAGKRFIVFQPLNALTQKKSKEKPEEIGERKDGKIGKNKRLGGLQDEKREEPEF